MFPSQQSYNLNKQNYSLQVCLQSILLNLALRFIFPIKTQDETVVIFNTSLRRIGAVVREGGCWVCCIFSLFFFHHTSYHTGGAPPFCERKGERCCILFISLVIRCRLCRLDLQQLGVIFDHLQQDCLDVVLQSAIFLLLVLECDLELR